MRWLVYHKYKSSWLNFDITLHLPFLHPPPWISRAWPLSSTVILPWERMNHSVLWKCPFLLSSEHLTTGESCDRFAECVSMLSSSALVNDNHKLVTRGVCARHFWVLWECCFWLAVCCVMNGQAGRAGLRTTSVKCYADWCCHRNEDDVWWIIIYETLSYFFKSFVTYRIIFICKTCTKLFSCNLSIK